MSGEMPVIERCPECDRPVGAWHIANCAAMRPDGTQGMRVEPTRNRRQRGRPAVGDPRYAVACSHCGAPPDAYCVRPSGDACPRHKTRREATTDAR